MILAIVVTIGLTSLATILLLNLRAGEKQIRYLITHRFGVEDAQFLRAMSRKQLDLWAAEAPWHMIAGCDSCLCYWINGRVRTRYASADGGVLVGSSVSACQLLQYSPS